MSLTSYQAAPPRDWIGEGSDPCGGCKGNLRKLRNNQDWLARVASVMRANWKPLSFFGVGMSFEKDR
jgi:hypothetical protein